MGSDKVTTNIKCTFYQIKKTHSWYIQPCPKVSALAQNVLQNVLKKYSPSYTFAILQNIAMNLMPFPCTGPKI